MNFLPKFILNLRGIGIYFPKDAADAGAVEAPAPVPEEFGRQCIFTKGEIIDGLYDFAENLLSYSHVREPDIFVFGGGAMMLGGSGLRKYVGDLDVISAVGVYTASKAVADNTKNGRNAWATGWCNTLVGNIFNRDQCLQNKDEWFVPWLSIPGQKGKRLHIHVPKPELLLVSKLVNMRGPKSIAEVHTVTHKDICDIVPLARICGMKTTKDFMAAVETYQGLFSGGFSERRMKTIIKKVEEIIAGNQTELTAPHPAGPRRHYAMTVEP